MPTNTSETRIFLDLRMLRHSNLRALKPETSTKEHIKQYPRNSGKAVNLQWQKEPKEISILRTHSPWMRMFNWFHVDGVIRAGNMPWKIQQNRNSLQVRTELIHTDGQQKIKDLNQLWELSIAKRWTQLKKQFALTARAPLDNMVSKIKPHVTKVNFNNYQLINQIKDILRPHMPTNSTHMCKYSSWFYFFKLWLT